MLFTLTGHATKIAAVAAETVWYVSRKGGFASQSFPISYPDLFSNFEFHALASAEVESGQTRPPKNTLQLQLSGQRDASAELRLSWIDSQSTDALAVSSTTVPEQLQLAINFSIT